MLESYGPVIVVLDDAISSLQSTGDVHRAILTQSYVGSIWKLENDILMTSFDVMSHSHAALAG